MGGNDRHHLACKRSAMHKFRITKLREKSMIKGVLRLHSLLLKCMNLDLACSTVRGCVSTPANAKPLTKCMLLVGSLSGGVWHLAIGSCDCARR